MTCYMTEFVSNMTAFASNMATYITNLVSYMTEMGSITIWFDWIFLKYDKISFRGLIVNV